jgi:hypothetical protein
MAPGFTQPVTDINTGKFLGGKARPACNADTLTDVCEPII